MDAGKALRRYVKAVNKELATGKASEQSYYPKLKGLIEGYGEDINAHIVEKGAPAKVGPAPLFFLKGYDASRKRSELING